MRLFHHLGLGVWAFLAQPAAGFVDSARGAGPLRFFSSLAAGCQDLINNTIFALSNATAKATAALRKVTVRLRLLAWLDVQSCCTPQCWCGVNLDLAA